MTNNLNQPARDAAARLNTLPGATAPKPDEFEQRLRAQLEAARARVDDAPATHIVEAQQQVDTKLAELKTRGTSAADTSREEFRKRLDAQLAQLRENKNAAAEKVRGEADEAATRVGEKLGVREALGEPPISSAAAPPANPVDHFGARLRSELSRYAAAPANNHANADRTAAAHHDASPTPRASDPQRAAEQAAVEADALPTGNGQYVAKEHDCIFRIAHEHGHRWETLWDAPANAELRTARQNPGVLRAGDRVFIPPLREKHEPVQTERRHRFRKHTQTSQLRLLVKHNDTPRANVPYTLVIDEREYKGQTDAEGKLEQIIPAAARHGRLRLADETHEYEIEIGRLEPLESHVGVRQRLRNLGFDPGVRESDLGPQTRAALRAFQESHKLPLTGRVDDETRATLAKVHGS